MFCKIYLHCYFITCTNEKKQQSYITCCKYWRQTNYCLKCYLETNYKGSFGAQYDHSAKRTVLKADCCVAE